VGSRSFSETLAKEVAPFGVKVTIVEPGGFRTDFAATSTSLQEGRPEYEETVGKTARFQREYNGKQPGDPARAAAALLRLAAEPDRPLRIVLGSDAYNAAEKNDQAKIDLASKWRDLSISTDFPKGAE
jgi:NAD(P)-dependent dehydrogenase (short-subunit alcohol dehydrogenase family)